MKKNLSWLHFSLMRISIGKLPIFLIIFSFFSIKILALEVQGFDQNAIFGLDTKYMNSPDSISYPQTVVEVSGSLKGNGTLILIDGKLRVLTVSHLIQGSKKVTLTINSLCNKCRPMSILLNADVEFDQEPLSDVAILRPLIADVNLMARLIAIANWNLNINKNGLTWGHSEISFDLHQIHSILNGKAFSTSNIFPWKGALIPDDVLSNYPYILMSPAFGRPGMSGGAVFEKGVICGIVSKVQLDATPSIYSIPIEFVYSVIAPFYFNEKSKIVFPKSHWDILSGERQLVVTTETGEIIKSINKLGPVGLAGGEIGSSGGEIGSSGGEIGSSGESSKPKQNSNSDVVSSFNNFRYWKIDSPVLTSETLDGIVTANPFFIATTSFEVDGQLISYFQYSESAPDGNISFPLPTIARYLKLSTENKVSFHAIQKNEESLQILKKRRIELLSSVGRPKFGRYYVKRSNGILQIPKFNGDAPARDNTIAFHKEDRDPLSPSESSDFLGVLLYSIKPDGYTGTYPFQIHENPDLVMDSRFLVSDLEDGISVSDVPIRTIDFHIPKNLDEMNLTLKYSYPGQPMPVLKTPQIIILKRTSREDDNSIRFESSTPGYRAVMVYDAADLAKLERIYIETPARIFEFISCKLGSECIR